MAETPTNKIDGMELSSVGPGHRLRDARKLSNLDQSDIATQLNLDLATINALEKDDYAKMPPAVFVRGYLRAYAGMVGLPVDDILSSFDAMQGIDPAERNYRASTRITATGAPKSRSSVLPIVLLLVLVVGAVAGGAYWWWQQQPAQSASGAVALPAQAIVDEPEVPLELMPRARTAKPAPEDVVSTLPVTTAEQGIESEPTTRVEPPASRTAEVEVATELETPSVAVAETSLVMPTSVIAEVAAPTEQVANTLTDNLTLRYTDNCWTQIRDATGKRLAFGVIKAGEVLELSGIAPFDVTLGQSDGVTVEFNGRPFEHTRFSRGKIARFQIAEDSATAE